MISKRLRAFRANLSWHWDLYFQFYYEFLLHQTKPILIYQMGKVGSTSITQSLPKERYPLVYHLHVMNEQRLETTIQAWEAGIPWPYRLIQTGYFALNNIIQPKRQCRIITMTRDPIARNVSAFFENYHQHTGQRFEKTTLGIEEIINCFLQTDQTVPLDWFDMEMKDVLGIDIYQQPFPKDAGYRRIKHENIDLIVYKSELALEKQSHILSDFLSDPAFSLSIGNISSDKLYADAYHKMKDSIQFEPKFVDQMLNSKYVQHFYTDAEIQQMRAKWVRTERC